MVVVGMKVMEDEDEDEDGVMFCERRRVCLSVSQCIYCYY